MLLFAAYSPSLTVRAQESNVPFLDGIEYIYEEGIPVDNEETIIHDHVDYIRYRPSLFTNESEDFSIGFDGCIAYRGPFFNTEYLTEWGPMNTSYAFSGKKEWADPVSAVILSLSLYDTNDDVFIKGGESADIEINNLTYAYSTDGFSSDFFTADMFYYRSVQLLKSNGELEEAYDDENLIVTVNNDGKISISFTVEPDSNIKGVYVSLYVLTQDFGIASNQNLWLSLNGRTSSQIVNTQGAEVGLLQGIKDSISGIFEWLSGILSGITNIFNSIEGFWTDVVDFLSGIGDSLTEGFSNMISKITNVYTAIMNLPSRIADFISDALQSLFVPSNKYITDYKQDWDDLLSSRFGAVYQVGSIISDFLGGLQYSDTTNTITMPSTTINLVGTSFTFGGYDVKVVPDGFSGIIEIVKKVISIVCTYMFINGLIKRYDEVMGVEK